MSKLTTLWTYLTTPKVFKSRRAIEKIQRKGMAKHVKMVRKNSPFFARHWAGLADEDWREFPLVNKALVENISSDLFGWPLASWLFWRILSAKGKAEEKTAEEKTAERV